MALHASRVLSRAREKETHDFFGILVALQENEKQHRVLQTTLDKMLGEHQYLSAVRAAVHDSRNQVPQPAHVEEDPRVFPCRRIPTRPEPADSSFGRPAKRKRGEGEGMGERKSEAGPDPETELEIEERTVTESQETPPLLPKEGLTSALDSLERKEEEKRKKEEGRKKKSMGESRRRRAAQRKKREEKKAREEKEKDEKMEEECREEKEIEEKREMGRMEKREKELELEEFQTKMRSVEEGEGE